MCEVHEKNVESVCKSAEHDLQTYFLAYITYEYMLRWNVAKLF